MSVMYVELIVMVGQTARGSVVATLGAGGVVPVCGWFFSANAGVPPRIAGGYVSEVVFSKCAVVLSWRWR